jgi:hypothetical protein
LEAAQEGPAIARVATTARTTRMPIITKFLFRMNASHMKIYGYYLTLILVWPDASALPESKYCL